MIVARGGRAMLKWSYYDAALLKEYVIDRADNRRWTVEAKVVEKDAFKLAQRPLLFVAPYRVKFTDGRTDWADWRWPVLTLSLNEGGSKLWAQLGEPLP